MRIRHKLLSGEWLIIEDPEESWTKAVNELRQYAKKKNADYYEAYRMAYPESVQFLRRLPLYGDHEKLHLILIDIVTRVGLKLNLILDPKYKHLLPTVPSGYIAEGPVTNQLGISLSKLRKLIGEGRFDTIRVGNLTLISKESVKKYEKGAK